MSLQTGEEGIVAEYIWLGGNGELRSKARTLYISKNISQDYQHPHQNTTEYSLNP